MLKLNNKKGFSKFTYKFALMSTIMFIIGQVCLSSYEASLNIQLQKKEKEIIVVTSDLDGLNMQKDELTQFSRLNSIAATNGCVLTNNMTASVVSLK